MRGHGLGVLQRAPRDHPPGVDAVRGCGGERAGAADGGAEEGGLAAVADAGRLDIGVEIAFQIVMRRLLMPLAAFLMQTDPPTLALGIVVLRPPGQR